MSMACKWCGKRTYTGYHNCPANDEIARLNEELRVSNESRDRYKSALQEIDGLNPDDFKTGQEHLLPAFREVNYPSVIRRIATIVEPALAGPEADKEDLPASSD